MGNSIRMLSLEEQLTMKEIKAFLQKYNENSNKCISEKCIICLKSLIKRGYEVTTLNECHHSLHKECLLKYREWKHKDTEEISNEIFKKENINELVSKETFLKNTSIFLEKFKETKESKKAKEFENICPFCYEYICKFKEYDSDNSINIYETENIKDIFIALINIISTINPIFGCLHYSKIGVDFKWNYPVIEENNNNNKQDNVNEENDDIFNNSKRRRILREKENEIDNKTITSNRNEDIWKFEDLNISNKRNNEKMNLIQQLKKDEEEYEKTLIEKRKNQREKNPEEIRNKILNDPFIVNEIKSQFYNDICKKIYDQVINEEKSNIRNKFIEDNKEKFQKEIEDALADDNLQHINDYQDTILKQQDNLSIAIQDEVNAMLSNYENMVSHKQSEFEINMKNKKNYYDDKMEELKKEKENLLSQIENLKNKK